MFDKKVKLPIIVGNRWVSGKEVEITKGDHPGTLSFKTGLRAKEYHVLDLGWQQQAKRSAGKAAAGAVVGGLLVPGIGLLAGAALGGRRQDDSNLVIVMTDEKGPQQQLILKCSPEQFEALQGLLT